MNSSLVNLSFDLTSLRRAYAQGLSPQAVVSEVYRRIATIDDPGIFISLLPETKAQDLAAALGAYDPQRPLWGVPFAIKDNIDFACLPTTAACPGFAYAPDEHAHAVARLIAAGAIPIGKTNLDQFATGLVGVRSPYPVPCNSFDAAMVPGGSSSGSAIAVAQGLVTFALGTDTAGSGRVPAGLNNLVGLKPTLGAISTRGVVPACRTLDCVSIFALTVADAYDVFSTMAGFDPLDSYARPWTFGPLTSPPPQLRLAIPDAKSRIFADDAQSERAFMQTVDDAATLGASVQEIDLTPFFDVARLLYEGPWVAERHHAVRDFIARDPKGMLAVTAAIIGNAAKFSATDTFDALYRLAKLRRITAPTWQGCDMLMVPTYPRPCSIADLEADPIAPNSELGTYTNFVNLLDLCALAVPSRFRDDGFPSSVTLIAPAGQDGTIAAFGARLQAITGQPLGATGKPQPPAATPTTCALSHEIELCVVGAHLSGMALNGELTLRGARFLRTAKTLPDYRLFALPGGPPYRPGLLRVGAGEGHAIETEVWALTPESFGTFVDSVPAPLGIGTTLLADGTQPKGFIVESQATAGARDISHHGGWRAYMQQIA
ncbi:MULTISPECIES: allophanate hydrolase [unclassified Beijerinckia]|uniref:allophanate hydrolase n=1 Tax=unclassified Beijerinckia TaxID=2638183 RepID=UPI00089C72E4|nr:MULTISPECIES: allophanate hydrolase [unclassified Beijerinckia]MDH7799770.1 allophanate hydrolase [Beijerinckia sp. GAS462]SED36765.1 allophanate hydrolase [Beijerinckia sp. 28-YEA-48]